MTNRENEFAALLPKLSVDQFLGIARVMGISLVCEGGIKDGEVIIQEMFDKFHGYSRKRQRNLLRLMRAATAKEKNNGNSTKD